MIKITKTQDGYMAEATPPHVKESWASASPLNAEEMVNTLREHGCYARDAWDAMQDANPTWRQELPSPT
jgi:hypothetical protein